MAFLEFSGIKKRYGESCILNNVSFEIKEGEVFGLIGRSGCGKSTFLKILVGMVRADDGKILFDGKDAIKDINYLRASTGFATQENMLFDELSTKENSFYFGKLYGMKSKEIRANFEQLIDLLELNGYEDVLAKNLSGGMIKRANILVSLIHKPKFLILDEPTVGLDPGLRRVLWGYIHEVHKTGTTILVTSHLLEEIEANCDKIAILSKGDIVSVGNPQEYRNIYKKLESFNEIFEEIAK